MPRRVFRGNGFVVQISANESCRNKSSLLSRKQAESRKTAKLTALVQCTAGGEAELQGGVAVECVWTSSDGDDVAQFGRPRSAAGPWALIGWSRLEPSAANQRRTPLAAPERHAEKPLTPSL